jgi:anti-sigma factor RsiW
MRCRTAHTAIIAARDGELGARRRHALDRHLARCGACRAERVAIDDVLAALDRLPEEIDVPARLEQEIMRRVRALASEPNAGASRASRWLRVVTPALAAGAVAAAAVLGLRSVAERDPTLRVDAPVAVATRHDSPPASARRAKTRVPDEPPAELASRAELFVDLPMLRDLDKLQHFDSIATMDDDPTDAVPPPSNG